MVGRGTDNWIIFVGNYFLLHLKFVLELEVREWKVSTSRLQTRKWTLSRTIFFLFSFPFNSYKTIYFLGLFWNSTKYFFYFRICFGGSLSEHFVETYLWSKKLPFWIIKAYKLINLELEGSFFNQIWLNLVPVGNESSKY